MRIQTTEKIPYIISKLLNKERRIRRNPDVVKDVVMLSLLFFIFILLISTTAEAEIYTYEDDNGTVHFSNVPTDPLYKMIMPPKEAPEKSINQEKQKGVKGDFNKLIVDKSYQYGLDPALVKAVIAVESDFNPRAVSNKGAMGLMQLMPLTAKDLGVSNTFDPVSNVDGGTRYLRYLLDYFNWDMELALAAYHAGISRVEKHVGIPPIPATHDYVKRVTSTYRKYVLQ